MRVMHLMATCLIAVVLSEMTQASWAPAPQQAAPAPAPAPAPGPAPVPGPGPAPVPPVGPGPIPPVGVPPIVPPMIPPIIPPFFPPFLGFPFLGPLGLPFLGGLGFGGLGLGGLGLGLGLGRFGLLRGKRSVNESEDAVKCFISTKTNVIDCADGVGQRVACEIEPRINLNVKLNLTDLAIVEKFTPTRGEIFNLVSLNSPHYKSRHGQGVVGYISRETFAKGKFTFIDPITLDSVLLSFYYDVTNQEPGFLIKEKICYDGIVDMFIDNISETRFNLFIA